MATNATFGKGTLLQRETAPASGVYETIAECKTISGPGLEADEIDVTNQDSSGSLREYLRGLINPGEITTEVNFDPNDSTHDGSTGMFADLLAGTVRNWKIVFPTTPTATLAFTAFVKSFPLTAPVDNVLSASLTLKVTGLPTLS